MKYAVIIGLLLLIAVCLFVCFRKMHGFACSYSGEEGEFRVVGTKKCFRIRKGKRFVFTVVDGQIVSFVDKAASRRSIKYCGGKKSEISKPNS